MAVTVLAGVASALGAAAAQIGAAGFFATLFSTAGAAAFAIGAGLSLVSRALAPKPSLGNQMRGITTTTREPAGSRKLVYGQMRVGGQVVFIDHSGTDNAYLHMVIVFASHEIESFEEFWFNDKKVYENNAVVSDWSSVATITKFDGTQTTADSTLVSASSNWTNDHILNGMAYAHFKLEWDQDKFPQGVPNITAVIKGKKVYDPRDTNQSASDSSTWTYSTNPALCLRDYLVDEKYGLAEDRTLIDETVLDATADLCDETQEGGVDIYSVSGQKRYTLNGVIDTSNSIKDNIEQLLSAMGGRLTFSGGKYFIEGAEYKTPTLTLDESVVTSEMQTQTKQSRRSIYNGVKGIFVSEEKNWKVLDYPAQISSTYATEDGDPIYLDMPLPFVTNNLQAQLLAKIALLKSRQQTTLTMTVNLTGLKLKVGDTVMVTNSRLGYSSKVFEVIDYTLANSPGGEIGVQLQLLETASAVYDWTSSDEEDFLKGGELDLYDGRTVDNVTSLTATEIGLRGPDGGVSSSIELSWTAPDDAFVEYYTVRYNKNGTTDYFEIETRETNLLISGLDVTSNYDFRVQAQNLLGVRSSGTSITNRALTGDTTAPSAPTSGAATGGIQTITAEWSNPSDIDFKHVEVYVNTTNSIPASPTAVVDGEEYVVTGLSGAVTRYFWLKSVDFSGNKSAATASFNGTSVVASNSDIGNDAIGNDEIADGAVDTDQIADDAVDITKIANTLEANYVAGTSGWRLTTAGDFEAGDGTFRGAVTATSGSFGGTTIASNKIYQGTGTWANSNTGFYLDNTGQFSLKDSLFFNPTNSRLTVSGNITADTITVEDTLEVFGPLQAKSLAPGSITREMLSQDVLDEIFGALATSVGGSNGDYKEGTGNFTTSGGTVTLGTSSDKFDHGTADVDVEFIVDHFFYSTTNYTTAQAQATLNFEVSEDGTFTDLTSATKTHTLQFNEYDLSSYYGYTYLVYYLTGDVTKTFTSGSGNDIPDNTDLQFRVRVTGVGTAFTSQTVPFTLEANEGVTGVVSTGGNADTLDNLDSTAFLRSNTDDTFDGNLTITGDLILQGGIDQYNVTNLTVEDKTITVNAGSTQALSDGAGLIVDRGTATDASLTWDETNDQFKFTDTVEFANGIAFKDIGGQYTNHAKIFFGNFPNPAGSLSTSSVIDDFGVDGYGMILQAGFTGDVGGIKITDDGVAVFGAGDEGVFVVVNEDANTTDFKIGNRGAVEITPQNNNEAPLRVNRGLDGNRISFSYSNNSLSRGEIGQTYYNGTGGTRMWFGANLFSVNGTTHSTPKQDSTGSASWLVVADSYADEFAVQRIAPNGGTTLNDALVINSSLNSTFYGSITSTGLTVDYTGHRTGDAGILVTNDASDWGIKVQKDSGVDYGILSQTDGEHAIVVRNAAGTIKAQLQGDGDATFRGTVTAEDEIHLTDASTVRAKLLLNSSDRDNVELRAESLGSTMKFFTVGTQALLLDASQNATFAGTIYSGAHTIYTQASTLEGINLVANVGSTNQNSDSPKIQFNGEYQSNGPYIQADNVAAYGNKSLKFYTDRNGGTDYTTAPTITLTLDNNGNAQFAGTISSGAITSSGTITAPTLIAGAYGAGGSAGDGFRINSTDIYGQVDSTDKIHISAVTGHIGVQSGHVIGKFAVMSSAVHATYDLYNNGTTYLNGSVIIDDALDLTSTSAELKIGGTSVIASTRRIYASDGTVAKAAFSFDGESNTGMYKYGTNQIGFTAGGSLIAYIQSGQTYGLVVQSKISATGGNSDNWNTAYGWGDHSTQGYLTGIPSTISASNINLSSSQPISLTQGGTGTYEFTAIYEAQNDLSNNETNGLFIERGRLSNSATAEIRHFVVGSRGGQKQFVIDGSGNTDIYGDLYLKKGSASGTIQFGTSGGGDYLKLHDVTTGNNLLELYQDSGLKFGIDGQTGDTYVKGRLRTADEGIYGKMQSNYHADNALRGGNFSADIANDTTVLKIFAGSQHDENGNVRAIGDYNSGIAFMHLDPNVFGSSYTGSQAWIGLRIHDMPAQERSFLTFATNSAVTAGSHPVERMAISPEGYVGIGETDPDELLHLTATTPVLRMEGGSRSYQQYVSASNFIIRDVTAQTNRLFLDDYGRFGVGIAPTVQLEVVSTESNWTGSFKNYTANAYGLRVDLSNSSGTAFAFATYTATNTGFFVKNDGKTGIGRTNPGATLDIKRAYSNSEEALRIQSHYSSSADQNAASYDTVLISQEDVPCIRLVERPNAQQLSFAVGNENDNSAVIKATGKIVFSTGQSANVAGYAYSGEQPLVVDTGNKVGVYVNSPTNRFHVKYNVNATIANLAEVDDYAAVRIGNFRADGDHNLYIGYMATNSTGLQARDSTASGSAQNILLNPYGGGVGIGTTSSGSSGGLLVNNDIKTNSRIGVGSTGTESAPAIYLNSDTNTGIYWPADDVLGFVTAGIERWRIESDGAVVFDGDVTTPAIKHDNTGDTVIDLNNNTYVTINNPDGTQAIKIGGGGGTDAQTTYNNDIHRFYKADGSSDLGRLYTGVADFFSSAIYGGSIDVSGNSDANAFRINGTTVIDASRHFFPNNIYFGGATNQSFISGSMDINLYGDRDIRFHTYLGTWKLRAAVTDDGFAIGDYSTNPNLDFYAASDGTSTIYFRDNNSTEGSYIKAIGQTYGGDIRMGARWDDDEDKVFIRMRQKSANSTVPNLTVHLNATQRSWHSAYTAVQFGTAGSLFAEEGDSSTWLTSNVFINTSGNLARIQADFAGTYDISNGQHRWGVFGSSSALSTVSFSAAMTLDNNGNLLVGTTDTVPSNNGASGASGVAISPLGVVRAARSGNVALDINRMDSDGAIADFRADGSTVGSIGNDSTNLYINFSQANNVGIAAGTSGGDPVLFPTGNTGAVRDNAVSLGYTTGRFKNFYLSGNVYVGKSNNTLSNDGVILRGGGEVLVTNTSDMVAGFNRAGTDGAIVQFYKDGVLRGAVDSYSDAIQFGQGNVNLKFENATDTIYPVNDNGTNNNGDLDLGKANARFGNFYLSGVIYNDGGGFHQIEASSGNHRFSTSGYAAGRNFIFRNGTNDPVPVAYDTFVVTSHDVPCISIVETNGSNTQSAEQQLKMAVGDNDAVISTSSTVTGGLHLRVGRLTSQPGYLETYGKAGVHIQNDGAVNIGGTSGVKTTIKNTLNLEGWATTGGQSRDTALYVGRDGTATSTEYFTMGFKTTARSGEQIHPTNGPYNGGSAFYIECGSTEAGGICLDQDSVHVYGSSDSGATFRVIDKDSDVVTFEMLQTSWNGVFRGDVIAFGSMSSISDRRIKTDIKPIDSVLDKINELGVYSYKKITAPHDREEIGVMAQEIQEQFPELVNETEVNNPEEVNGLESILTVDYEHLTAVLLKGMQEQQEQINQLHKIIEEMKNGND